MKKLVASGLVAALAGCATAYVAPTSSPSSEISVLNASDKYAAVAVFDDAGECFKSHIAGRMDPGRSVAITVAAGKPLALHFQQLGLTTGAGLRASSCDIIVTFLPQSRRRYSARMANDSSGCGINILDLSAPDGPAVVPLVLRAYTPPQGFTNKWCPALTEKEMEGLR